MKNPSSFIKYTTRLAAALAVAFSVRTATSQTQIFSENFDTDHSLDNTWVTNSAGGYNPVDIYFDYSTVGIPSAPNSTGGTTRGLKLQANLDPLVQVFPSGSSMSPAGFSISDNFEMRWDWWLNFNGGLGTGGLNGGGAGSTQIGGAGFGTAGTVAQRPTVIDCIFIGASGDGAGTTGDYRVYSPAFTASLQDASGVYAAGTSGSRNNTHAYYQPTFPPVSAPSAQLTLYPQQSGQTQGGSAGMKWHDISLKKVANIITYSIDGLLIATIDATTNGTLGGANIVFGQFDINTAASTDPNATNLAFSLVDNLRITNFPNVVTVSATTPGAAEAGPASGVFTITRTSSGAPVTVNYSVGGTAGNGTDYTNALGGALSGTVTFGATETSTNITIVPVDDSTAEPSETIILSILPGVGYIGAGGATVVIADNEPTTLSITNVSSQVYERTNDYGTFQITALGETNYASPLTVDISFASGSAVLDTDFYTNAPVTLDPGQQLVTFKANPVVDGTYEGNETIAVTLLSGVGYVVGSQSSASLKLVDADSPPETVLFSDNLDADTSASWTVQSSDADYSATFAFDYGGQSIPSAPHSTGGSTIGLFMTANKDITGSAAAVNLYPNGQSFSGNHALRFDMFLNAILPGSTATEYALAGINHTGTKTNWFRNSPGGVPAGFAFFDGVFVGIEADGGALGDYAAYGAPTTAGSNPTSLNSRSASSMTSFLKSPPWGVVGVPANDIADGTPIWADVEVAQVGNIVTLSINHTTVFSLTNNTGSTSGNIMIGYDDAYDSIGNNQSYVVIDNVRVISLAAPVITAINIVGPNVQVDFTANAGDVVSQFVLQSASSVSGPYTDTSSTITSPSAGNFRATKAYNPLSTETYYRVRRAY